MSDRAAGFPPLLAPNAHTLILGSIPGRRSLLAGEYYGHPRNAFWKIMHSVCGAGSALPYDRRVVKLTAAGFAVWDVLATCRRPGSLDSAIDLQSAEVNDFARFYAEQGSIRRVFFNGAAAQRLYTRRVAPLPGVRDVSLTVRKLPSTSPAYAAMSYEEKQRIWVRALASDRH